MQFNIEMLDYVLPRLLRHCFHTNPYVFVANTRSIAWLMENGTLESDLKGRYLSLITPISDSPFIVHFGQNGSAKFYSKLPENIQQKDIISADNTPEDYHYSIINYLREARKVIQNTHLEVYIPAIELLINEELSLSNLPNDSVVAAHLFEYYLDAFCNPATDPLSGKKSIFGAYRAALENEFKTAISQYTKFRLSGTTVASISALFLIVQIIDKTFMRLPMPVWYPLFSSLNRAVTAIPGSTEVSTRAVLQTMADALFSSDPFVANMATHMFEQTGKILLSTGDSFLDKAKEQVSLNEFYFQIYSACPSLWGAYICTQCVPEQFRNKELKIQGRVAEEKWARAGTSLGMAVFDVHGQFTKSVFDELALLRGNPADLEKRLFDIIHNHLIYPPSFYQLAMNPATTEEEILRFLLS